MSDPVEKSQKRVKDLFTELEQLAPQGQAPANGSPTAPGASLLAEPQPSPAATMANSVMEALIARVAKLEAELEQSDMRATRAEEQLASMKNESIRPQAGPVSIYEKEAVGYTYQNKQMLPFHAAQFSEDELKRVLETQLTISGETIGEIKIKPPEDRPWTDEETRLADAIAQQVSLQVQNLRLLAATDRARAEAQAATRQFTHESWEAFLDGIRNNERIGYKYDQASVEPFVEPELAGHDHHEAVNVLDEQVGNLFIKANRPLSEDDKAMISSIAQRVGQQVESLRLLAEAARSRVDAEEATRRLTRQNWETFTQEEDEETLGFMYDSVKVSPLGNEESTSNVVLEQPLYVRGEAIGQLAVSGLKNIPPEAHDLAAAIAAQTSIHLETLRLTEELQKRARELKELDRLKSAFLANMSHELRTPLNSILGFTDVMLEGLDGDLTDYMDNDLRLIQKNGQHLLHLINDVLDMAKIESGRMNLHPERFRVHSIMDEVTSITSTLASEKNIALFIDPSSDEDIEIFADNTRLRQVMINLVNNAIKFTSVGKIALKAVSQGNSHVLISVKDTGLGIPPDKLEAVFLEFTQVDTSTTRKAGGTGLGLPISRRLVEMHGGRLWAESTGVEGEGSTFFVELPIEARITEVIEKQEK
jgi:signal transduction histidine kinase